MITRKKSEKPLYLSDEVLVVPSWGCQRPGQLAIATVKHSRGIGNMSSRIYAEFQHAIALGQQAVFDVYGKRSTVVEHGRRFWSKWGIPVAGGGCKVHTHAVLHPDDIVDGIFGDLTERGFDRSHGRGHRVHKVEDFSLVREVYQRGENSTLIVQDFSGRMVQILLDPGENLEGQYTRRVFANLLGEEDLWDYDFPTLRQRDYYDQTLAEMQHCFN